MAYPDPWPRLERFAVERGIDLTEARALLSRALPGGKIIDPEHAIGNTLLDHLEAGRSIEEALADAKAQMGGATA